MNTGTSTLNGAPVDYVLSRIRELAAQKHLVYTEILLGTSEIGQNTESPLYLNERVPRKFDGSIYSRNPAISDFLGLLEKTFSNDFTLAKFDGYIVPTDGDCVTRLLFCREYTRRQSYKDILRTGADCDIEAYQLTKELFAELDAWRTVFFSRETKAAIDFLFVPYGYPANEMEAESKLITIVRDIFGDLTIDQMSVQDLRRYLESQRKRKTSKGLTFACTKLEHYLANVKSHGESLVTAFPGDVDGVLFDKDSGNLLAILEYKSDTINKPIVSESSSNYGNEDKTRLMVLDDICNILNLPLIFVFWSVHHTDAKVTVRNTSYGTNKEHILRCSTYRELAENINKLAKSILLTAPLSVVPSIQSPVPVPVVTDAPQNQPLCTECGGIIKPQWYKYDKTVCYPCRKNKGSQAVA